MAALNEASNGRLFELRQVAIFTHLARYYTMLQDKKSREFRDFLLAHPNAVDHRDLKEAQESELAENAEKPVETAPLPEKPRASAAKKVALIRSTDAAGRDSGTKTTKSLRNLAGT